MIPLVANNRVDRAGVDPSQARKFDDLEPQRIRFADNFGLGVGKSSLRRFFASRVAAMQKFVGFVFGWRDPLQVGQRTIAWVAVQMGSNSSSRALATKGFQNRDVQPHDTTATLPMNGECKVLSLPIRLDRAAGERVADITEIGNLITGARGENCSPAFHSRRMAELRALYKHESPVPKACAQDQENP